MVLQDACVYSSRCNQTDEAVRAAHKKTYRMDICRDMTSSQYEPVCACVQVAVHQPALLSSFFL